MGNVSFIHSVIHSFSHSFLHAPCFPVLFLRVVLWCSLALVFGPVDSQIGLRYDPDARAETFLKQLDQEVSARLADARTTLNNLSTSLGANQVLSMTAVLTGPLISGFVLGVALSLLQRWWNGGLYQAWWKEEIGRAHV